MCALNEATHTDTQGYVYEIKNSISVSNSFPVAVYCSSGAAVNTGPAGCLGLPPNDGGVSQDPETSTGIKQSNNGHRMRETENDVFLSLPRLSSVYPH